MNIDELEIRRLIEKWAVCRDGGDFAGLASVWTATGTMTATWFEGTATAFIEASRIGFEKGVNVTHTLGGSLVEIFGERALAQTKMSITQRVSHEGAALDVICTGRFVDCFSRETGLWGLESRHCIYENDRIVPVVPGPPIVLDSSLLDAYPPGYRHLAYFQREAGLDVAVDRPGRTGPQSAALLAEKRTWASGGES